MSSPLPRSRPPARAADPACALAMAPDGGRRTRESLQHAAAFALLIAATASPARAADTSAIATADATADATAADNAAAGGTVSEVVVRGLHNDLKQVPYLDKTGSKLEDLPSSVQVIDTQLVSQQGGVSLNDAIRNASGISRGGQDGYGFYDRFLIRGLDARIFDEGFDDGDQRNGIPHSLNGVQQVEILKGPGSALFGSGPPGGAINIVHYAPSDTLGYGGALQGGSFGTVSANAFVTGPTEVQGLDFRVDGLAQHSDGFRGLTSNDDEIRPEIRWTGDHHVLSLSVDARYLAGTPDAAGLIYVHGKPITGVSPRTAHYSTPFGFGDQGLLRVIGSDVWTASPFLTINNRFSYMYRDLSILRNGDSGTVVGDMLTGRSLRKQHDLINDYDYELEPVWTFNTGPAHHTLLTGFEYQHQQLHTDRATATLPNIANIYDPVIPEQSEGSLNFLRDATHSGSIDRLYADYYSLYATDQIDLTERWKLRAGVRKDFWNTELDPQAFVPGRLDPSGGGLLLEPGTNPTRHDAPTSWNIGTVYKLTPNISPFLGVSRSHLAVFSSEATQNGLAPPEAALQYEGGIKVSALAGRATLNVAGFDVKRDNVFNLINDVPIFNSQATWGGEADLNVQITRQWLVTANLTAQHAVLTSNPSSPSSTGKIPIGVPEHLANIWTNYTFPLRDGDGLRVSGGVDYRDRMFANTLNTVQVPSYVIGDVELAYLHRAWTMTVGMRNIANATYFVAANGAGGLVGDPRTAFASISRKVGE
jgi:iron complex outermembrane receptor protein